MVCTKCQKKLTVLVTGSLHDLRYDRNRVTRGRAAAMASSSTRAVSSASASSAVSSKSRATVSVTGKLQTKTSSSGRVIGGVSKGRTDHRRQFKRKSLKCRLCKGPLHDSRHNYCSTCAWKKGICARCGKKVADVSNQSLTNV